MIIPSRYVLDPATTLRSDHHLIIFFYTRKYPSLANVEKRKEEEAKKRASGQMLKTKNFRCLQMSLSRNI